MNSDAPQSATPARPWLIAGSVHLALALWVFHDCLRPGLFPYGRDTVSHDILFFDHGWSIVRDTGLIPLWNHHLFAGWPWVAAAGWTPWYPPHWIALALPTAFAFTIQYAFHHAWAGLGFTLWGRALGLGFGPALLGGVLFQMSGHFTTLVFPGHLAKFEAIAWMPWVLAFANQSMNRGSLRKALLAAICLALQIMTQHAQIVYYTVGLLGILTAWKIIRALRAKRVSLCPLWLLALIGLLAGGLAAVQILPAVEMIRISNRAEGVAWTEAVATSYPPEELVELVWPGLFGSSVDGTYHGTWGERLVSDYLGVVTVAGVLLALLFTLPLSLNGRGGRGVRVTGRARVLALFALLAVTLLLALGSHTPLYRLLYDWLPGWDRWRSPATVMCVSTFAACTLAGVGFQPLMQLLTASPALRAWVALTLIVCGAADQSRVVRRHVEAAAVPYPEIRSDVWRQLPLRFTRTPQSRHFIHTQELSNTPLLAHWGQIITGYHPIVLGRWERLFQAQGYDNLDLHRLLAVRTWVAPRARSLVAPYVPLSRDRGGPFATRDWLYYTVAEPGQWMWSPRIIRSASTRREALQELADVSDETGVFESATIVGIDPGEEVSGKHTLRGTDVMEEFDVVSLRSSGPSADSTLSWDTRRDLAACGPFGLMPFERGLLMAAAPFQGGSGWLVISQIVAPGWRMWALDSSDPPAVDLIVSHVPLDHFARRLPIHTAWGALWAVHLEGNEAFLIAEYRPATVRLGWFVSMVTLALVVMLLLRWPRTFSQARVPVPHQEAPA